MKHTFYLKEPKSEKQSLILFSCYFKYENKKFVYSTGEKILPIHWNFEQNRPKLKGLKKSANSSSINLQLTRYSEAFEKIQSECKKMDVDYTSKILRDYFNTNFKKSPTNNNLFFTTYDEFMEEKQKQKVWKPSTVKRYKNIKNHLFGFQSSNKYKLTFSTINENFYIKFIDYCYTELDHYTNTFSRNIGLFKTFMLWALDKNYTYNETFKKFKKPKRIITREEALTLDHIKTIFEYDCKSENLERVRDIFVFQCLTGLRYGELKKINERVIKDDFILLKEEKNSVKEVREIPLFETTKFILRKYNNILPLISNQKQNKYIKLVIESVGLDFDVEYTRVKGVEQDVFVKPFYERISTHTARRTFITIMRNKGIADKTIMSITGHKDLKTFNMYHKVDQKARKEAVSSAFEKIEIPLKKVN